MGPPRLIITAGGCQRGRGEREQDPQDGHVPRGSQHLSSVLPRDPAGPPAPALAPPSVSGHRTLVDCKVKLAFLQMVLGFRGSVRAALGMLHPPAEPLHSSSAGEKAVGEALRWEPLLGQRRRGCGFKN